jgi:dihydrolipoamide dehydrogenase
MEAATLSEAVEVLVNESIEIPKVVPGNLPTFKLTTGAAIQPDITLVATGRKPNSDELGLECLGLTGGDWIPVNERMQTPAEPVYAIGDVNGISLLDSVATSQANIAVQNILGKTARFDKRGFSRFLRIGPPVAGVGWDEEEARTAGLSRDPGNRRCLSCYRGTVALSLTTNTGHGAYWTTRSAVLPSSKRSSPV